MVHFHVGFYSQLALVAAVSASHMSMPNHWLPYSLVARAQGWSLRSALALTFCGALGHVIVTIFVAIVLSGLGGSLVSHNLYRIIATSTLLLGGSYYLYSYFVMRRRESCCELEPPEEKPTPTSSMPRPATRATPPGSTPASGARADTPAVRRTAALSLVSLTTLSPCVGSMPVLLSVLAPPLSPATVLLASLVLLITSAGVMMPFVAISFVGAASLSFARVRRHERLVLGAALVALALLTFYGSANHQHHGHHAAAGNHHEARIVTDIKAVNEVRENFSEHHLGKRSQ